MKKEDEIEQLFSRMENQLDILEPSVNHNLRFLNKLEQQNKIVQLHSKKRNWYVQIAIAASIAILMGVVSIGSILIGTSDHADLASVSPQMQETQDFFTVAIKTQLDEINKTVSLENKSLVLDAMKQLKKLEIDYNMLKKDLVQSNNDKRVISAMITNFQKRASLLEDVLEKINTINTFKISENESNIL